MNETSILSQVDQYVGVGIALAGSFVAAPDGTRLLWNSLSGWLRRQGSEARDRIMRLFRRPRHQTVHGVSVAGGVSPSGAVTLTVHGRAWAPGAPVHERIEALRRHITEVEGRLNETVEKIRNETRNRETALIELEQTLRAEIADIRRVSLCVKIVGGKIYS